MGLYKEIKTENGIPVTYHRVVSINKITNRCNIIEVASYLNKEERQKEVDYYASDDPNKVMNVFINTEYINVDYDENTAIKDVYEYLKITEKFKDAQDDLDVITEKEDLESTTEEVPDETAE